MRRRPIGQILVEKEAITEEQLAAALEEQERSGRRLGEILIEQGRTSWLALARAIAEQVLDIQNASAEPEPEPEHVHAAVARSGARARPRGRRAGREPGHPAAAAGYASLASHAVGAGCPGAPCTAAGVHELG